MDQLTKQLDNYLAYCRYQKKLDDKTLKAYKIDLSQFAAFVSCPESALSKSCLTQYIQSLHQKYKAKTAKRKIACLRAFFNYLEFDEQIETNPISKIRLDFREEIVLPKALPLATIKKLLKCAYASLENNQTELQHNAKLRDVAILELLFATGLRVSELCSIKKNELDLKTGFVKVHGKGSKERIVFISNPQTLSALRKYRDTFSSEISNKGWFFINRLGNRLSEQSVRDMLKIQAKEAKIPVHITPHMIRHSFATLMLEEDVDIRYIQSILGHSSISTTQIYTFVSLGKQRSIMKKKHPRNKITL